MIRRLLAAVPVLWLAATVVLAPGTASADTTVTGAGSTWVQIALDQWRADVARQGLSVNYQGVGSTAGRQFFIIGQVDFAASEIPFDSAELAQIHGANKSFQYLPDVAGGTSLMYNLKDASGQRITDLKLSAATVAGIFTGKITNWDDPAITADNCGRILPSQRIVPVIRSDGSGTSAKLADYLAHMAASVWNPFAQANGVQLPLSFWPSFPGSVAQRGSDGVANFVANDAVGGGSVGYVETGYALQRGFPVASLANQSGHFVQPNPDNLEVALTHATLNSDLTQNLGGVYTAPEDNAYPLASYSYLITQTTGFDPAKGAVLGAFILYIACDGQKEAAALGYAPMPGNLVTADFQAVQRIPGAPRPPSLANCGNPTLHGQRSFGGGGVTACPAGGGGNPTPSPTDGGGAGPTTDPNGGGVGPTTGPGGTGVPTTGPVGGGLSGGGSSGGGGGGSGGNSGAGGTGGSGGVVVSPTPGASGGPVVVRVLPPDEQQVRVQEAIRDAGYVQPSSHSSLWVEVILVGLLVFAPLVWQRRRGDGEGGR